MVRPSLKPPPIYDIVVVEELYKTVAVETVAGEINRDLGGWSYCRINGVVGCNDSMRFSLYSSIYRKYKYG